MKLITDERVKHRLVGLAVIFSIAAIFAPAIIKKSSQRLDDNVSMSVKLPPKPVLPKITAPDEKTLFKSVKVAHVDIPPVDEEPQPISTIAKAEPLSQLNQNRHTDLAAVELPVKPSHKPESKPVLVAAMPKANKHNNRVASETSRPAPSIKKVAMIKKTAVVNRRVVAVRKPSLPVTKNNYAVQLATFSQQKNALALISRLKQKGYYGRLNKVTSNNGTVYKVIVGNSNQRQKAQLLQKRLATAVQIQGFIITTGVS